MVQTSTLNDLLSYAYNETGLLESDRIQRSIDGDPLIREEFDELLKVIDTLNEAVPPVSEKAIERILLFC